MNTARMANTSNPIRPTPAPPNTTSPRAMLSIAIPPARGVRLSCEALTAPVEVSVVMVAHSTEAPMPLRTSLPSMLPPACVADAVWSAPARARFGLPACSLAYITPTLSTSSAAAAAKRAQPWRWFPANRPKR